MEKEIPQESNNLYDIYQQNVHKFFDELRKSIFQYQQSISNLQLECIKSCGIILDSSFPFSQKFEDNTNIITYDTKRMPPAQTKVEEQRKVTKYTIQTQTPSESPTPQSASITSSQEMLPPKPKKIRKFDAERFWKNAYAHQRGKLLRMIKVQDEQIKILVNEHYQDLPTPIKHEIETSGIKKEDLK